MNLTEICIRRPVFATVMTLIIIVFGIACQSKLSVRKTPKIEQSFITIETEFHGASPQIVESQITKILEGTFATISGADTIRSESQNEKSVIYVEFSSDRTMDGAASDIRDKISLVRSQLPRGIPEPIIKKSASDSHPGIFVVFTSNKHSVDEVRDYIERYIKARFEVLPGVGRVELSGGNVKSMRIFVDPERLAAYGYTTSDVYDALQSQHFQRPSGRLISNDKEFMLVTKGELKSPAEFDNIIMPVRDRGKIIRIRDIGRTEIISDDIREGAWFDGKECISLAITKQSIANPIDLSKSVNKVLPSIKEALPNGVELSIARDEAIDIERSVNNVYSAIFEATFLVVLVVFMFLWSFSATLIPLVTIPVSLLGTFAVLYFFDFSINMFTLLAMALAVGLVVDDAIVVIENVHRHIDKGKSALQAAIDGSKEISFSVVAMTLTLAAAYVPISMVSGRIGKNFKEFAVALAGSVIISGFVALTLSPMMCSLILGKKWNFNFSIIEKFEVFQKSILLKLDNYYRSILTKVVGNYKYVSILGMAIVLIGLLISYKLPSENVPSEDVGEVKISCYVPFGMSYSFITEMVEKVDNVLKDTPFLTHRYLGADTTKISGFVMLKDVEDRSLSSHEIADSLNPHLKGIAGISCFATTSGSGGNNEIYFVLQTTLPYSYLHKNGRLFMGRLQLDPSCGIEPTFSHSFLPPQQEYSININRDRAASLGINVSDIVTTIETCIKGKKAGDVQRESKRDELFVQLEKPKRQTIEDLYSIPMRAMSFDGRSRGEIVQLSDLIEVQAKQSPMTINHFNQLMSVVINATLAKGYSTGEAVKKILEVKEKYLPKNIFLTFCDETKTYLEEGDKVLYIFFFAMIMVFLILAAQFESFIDPFIIMFTVPLSVAGALFTLLLIPNGSLNIYSQIGLVTLIGLITKHGILIIDFANKNVALGMNYIDSVIEAAHLRLRPILMTTLATVLGAFPLAFAVGAGAGARRQIGWVIVGGMSFGTMFTLFVIPTVFVIFSNMKVKFFGKRSTEIE